jgi:hypothetical protein
MGNRDSIEAPGIDTSRTDRLTREAEGYRLVEFGGDPGSSGDPAYLRLYQDAEHVHFLDLPRTAILEAQQEPNGGPVRVRCRADLRLRVGLLASANMETLLDAAKGGSPLEGGGDPLAGGSPLPRAAMAKAHHSWTMCKMSVRFRSIPHYSAVPGSWPYWTVIPVFVLDCV